MDDLREDHSDPKRSRQRNPANNYRPITCLPMIWKMLTAQIKENIKYSLTSREIFPEEKKGCQKRSRGTEDILYIEQHVFNESKARRKNLAMAWIDYKKAYDMVLQSWILYCLKMYKIPDQVVQFIEKTMKTWRVELITGGKSLAEVKIQRGIFQGDVLSSLLFVIAMMPLNHILRKWTAGTNSINYKRSTTWCTWTASKFLPKTKNNWKPNTNCENIQSRYRNEIWLRKNAPC